VPPDTLQSVIVVFVIAAPDISEFIILVLEIVELPIATYCKLPPFELIIFVSNSLQFIIPILTVSTLNEL
jgi:hypothetical protein